MKKPLFGLPTASLSNASGFVWAPCSIPFRLASVSFRGLAAFSLLRQVFQASYPLAPGLRLIGPQGVAATGPRAGPWVGATVPQQSHHECDGICDELKQKHVIE